LAALTKKVTDTPLAHLEDRRATKPVGSADISAAIVKAKGHGSPSIGALTRRGRASLSYLLRHKRGIKTGIG
jgi:hypothetical protein